MVGVGAARLPTTARARRPSLSSTRGGPLGASRRDAAVTGPAALLATGAAVPPVAAVEVGEGVSLAGAVAAAPPGATLRLAAATHRGRLVLERPVTLECVPSASVTLVHETERPYEAAVEVRCAGVVLRGVRVRHSSPSIATDYALFVRGSGASVELEDVDISSATGSAVGVEGGRVGARRCRFHDSPDHGAALYGDLLGETAGTSVLEDCELVGNGRDGVLARDGARVSLRRCALSRNNGYGAEAVDAEVELDECAAAGNKLGASVERGGGLVTSATPA